MKYGTIKKASFLSRPNRFIARVELDGREEIVHVKNTGRCRELLLENAEIYLEESANPDRKTKYDLIAVKKAERLINMDSSAPNKVVEEWLRAGGFCDNVSLVKPESKYGSSRFDFYVEAGEQKIFMEVKGVTLEENNVVMFPDAPSERAVKHIRELQEAVKHGYEAAVIFVIQMKGADYFTPNKKMHPEFANALVQAQKAGVKILAYDCLVSPDEIKLSSPVPVVL